jgi:hypothetical protein
MAAKRKEVSTVAVSLYTDEEIQRDVLEELKWDTRVRPNEIGVAVKNGLAAVVVSALKWGSPE